MQFGSYVDNTATQFFHYLNNCHANIKFTIELGDNSTNPFLDNLIKRHSHTFSTSIYRKKTFFQLNKMGLLHFEEINSKTHLNSHFLLFPNLFLTFSFVLLLNELRNVLLQNGYPTGVINNNINDVVSRQQNKAKNLSSTVPKKEVILVAPF